MAIYIKLPKLIIPYMKDITNISNDKLNRLLKHKIKQTYNYIIIHTQSLFNWEDYYQVDNLVHFHFKSLYN